MLNEIKIPSMGATMEEGKIVAWHVKEGDRIKPGDVLLEIETDKSVFEVESPCGGVVRKILAPEGETRPVQAVIALVGEPGETIPAEYLGKTPAPELASPHQASGAGSAESVPRASGAGATNEVKISPRARKRAEQLRVDIRNIKGSGPDGRIESADIEDAARRPPRQPAVIPFDPMRAQINRKVTQSKQEIPHFYVGILVDAARLLAYRQKFETQDRKISVNAVLMKAIVKGLEAEPSLNVAIADNGYVSRASVDVGVAIETPRGVVIGIVEHVDRQDVVALSDQIRDLVEKVRQDGPKGIRSSGACMTISNVGMYRADWFIPIIHPGEAAMLGVGSVADRVIALNGAPVVRPTMPVTLCVDHRIADGGAATRFLQAFAEFLEKLE